MNINPFLRNSEPAFQALRSTTVQGNNRTPASRSEVFVGRTFPRPDNGSKTKTFTEQFSIQHPSLLNVIRRGTQSLTSLSQAASSQRQQDRTQGVGLRIGAERFSSEVLRGAQALQISEHSTLGQQGQDLLLRSFGTELQSWAKTTEREEASASSSTEQVIAAGSAATNVAAGGLLPLAGAIYSGYNLIQNWGNTDVATGALNGAAVGAYLGSVVPGLGTLVGGAVGGLLGAASGLFHKSGKHQDQLVRDALRSGLQDLGLLDKDFSIRLANGSKYDLGKDGGFTLNNLDGSTRHAYDTDPSNPLASLAIGLVNPLVSLLVGTNTKAASDLAGLLANAALSNARSPEELRQNVLQFASTLGLSEENLTKAVSDTLGEKSPDLPAYVNGIRTLFHAEVLEQQLDSEHSIEEIDQAEEAVASELIQNQDPSEEDMELDPATASVSGD